MNLTSEQRQSAQRNFDDRVRMLAESFVTDVEDVIEAAWEIAPGDGREYVDTVDEVVLALWMLTKKVPR